MKSLQELALSAVEENPELYQELQVIAAPSIREEFSTLLFKKINLANSTTTRTSRQNTQRMKELYPTMGVPMFHHKYPTHWTLSNDKEFINAAWRGHLDVVKYLASLPSVDPAAKNNLAIINAARQGHLDVVKFLARLPSVDPAAEDNEAIINAATQGHLDVVKFLASLPSVDPGAQNHRAFKGAVDLPIGQHLDLKKFLHKGYMKSLQKK
jgi:hypothetical protein